MNYPQNPKISSKRSVTSALYAMFSPWKGTTAVSAFIKQTQNDTDILHSDNKLQDMFASNIDKFLSSHKMPQRSESTPVMSVKKLFESCERPVNVPKDHFLNIIKFLDNSPETVMANSIRLKAISISNSTPSLVERIAISGLSGVHCSPAPVEDIQCSSKEKDRWDDSMNGVQFTLDTMPEDVIVENLDNKHIISSENEMDTDEDIVIFSSSGDEKEEEDSNEEMYDEEDDDDDDDWNIGDDRYVGRESFCTTQNIQKSMTAAYFVTNSISMDWSSGIDEEISNLPVLSNIPDMRLDSDDEDDDFDSLLICEVNKKWESFYSTPAGRTETKSRQVSFACEESLVTLHCWEDVEGSRKGLWNIDGQRFRRRIDECGKVLSQILQTDHRKKVFSSLCCLSDASS